MSIEISSLLPGTVIETRAALIAVAPRSGRLSLRARGDLTLLQTALGIALPDRIGKRNKAGEKQIMRVGPDEWTLLLPLEDVVSVVAASAALYPTLPHSLVDVSAREVTLLVEGPKAAELLTIGCARDIDTIPSGEGRRTNFDGVTVVLRRDAENVFRMDVWNSFAPHLAQLLVTGCKEFAAEIA